MINIPSTIHDPSYRYKMPKMNLKVEGKGNGIATNVTNLDEVAKSLRVPVAYPLKFFGIELGTLTKTKPDSYIVNGKHDIATLETTLNKFIEKYILCPVCKLPEIKLKVKKDSISATCRSCGKVSKLDSVHKLATYILKNPPKDGSEFSTDKGKKKDKAKDHDEKKHKPTHGKEGKTKDSKENEDEKLPEALTLESPEIQESVKRIREYKDAQKRTATELVDQISNICISQGLKGDLRYYVAIHGLYDEKFLYQWNQEESSKEALKIMVNNEAKGQYWVLLALERFTLQSHSVALAQHINTILKCFYDYEILEEETILKCYGKEGANKTLSSGKSYNPAISSDFKAQVAPFINWLKEAEEDEDENETEENAKEGEDSRAEDEKTRKQRELIAEQQQQQEKQLQENKEKIAEAKESEGPKPLNILDIKTESSAASLDDL
eukprot:TRINITY_DN4274_c0_g2_i28.p1 TRINITY_DN4274_c0_g2~~TRINITY_DN4274_c0_g2_i28.p1  ORF type:complete len:438 (+),score=180.52 TRINITY_DN4274_c0_g2_i28:165-1478(+)